ncbi:15958_t:CDS:2 [Acaulospora colombiana]|uniref:15958_t:CDS:1 n=1 Tax=Acaulospora colombiana TaxID=27376 RepID=A0ACA9LFT3_9GLOM|nr:15958_t:CDS:2 [Acaulospora colombiana]
MSNIYSSPLESTPNAREYIDIMVEIRKFTSDFEEYTPTIVAFGDQSSGKSSLIQRLTGGIPVPRGNGRCTATPFEIRMLQTETPMRRISLRYVEDSLQSRIPSREIEFADILGLEDDAIEAKLREAQRYLQNPSIRDVHATNLPNNDHDELKFTKNTVCVTIGHPNIKYSLDMVDLPGIVRDVEENETFVVNLVKEYITKENSILLPIFAATADIATQSAWRLAQEADPLGLRTVGIITKIDQILDFSYHESRHRELAALVNGRGEHTLKNGMYIIRNPSDATSERGTNPENLENAAINNLLQNRVWRTVPRSRPFLEQRKTELEEKLESLPPPPEDNPIYRFMELIGKFDKEFSSHANSEHHEPRLYRGQQWNFGQFDLALLNTRPVYNLSFRNSFSSEYFDPIKQGSLQFSGWTEGIRNEIDADEWGMNERGPDGQYTWTLEQLSEVIQRAQGGQLVGYFPFKSVVNIVGKHQKEWFKISQKLMEKNYEWVSSFTDELVEKEFLEFPNAVDEIKRVLKDLLKQCKEDTLRQLRDIEDMEHMSSSRALYVTDEATLLKKQSKYFIQLRILCALSVEDQERSRAILEFGSKLFEMMQDASTPNETFENCKSLLVEEIKALGSQGDATHQLIEEIRSARIAEENVSTATLSMMLAVKNSDHFRMLNGEIENEDETQLPDLNGLLGEDPENVRKREEWKTDLVSLNRIINMVKRVSRGG